jgi:hypothetical protein
MQIKTFEMQQEIKYTIVYRTESVGTSVIPILFRIQRIQDEIRFRIRLGKMFRIRSTTLLIRISPEL